MMDLATAAIVAATCRRAGLHANTTCWGAATCVVEARRTPDSPTVRLDHPADLAALLRALAPDARAAAGTTQEERTL